MAPIIDHGEGYCIEYQIPTEIKDRIPDYFYIALAGELFSIFGWSESRWRFYPEEGKAYADLASGSAGWMKALKAACRKLDMDWLLAYYQTLEWYDSDVFDGILEQEIRRHFMNGKAEGTNEYYRFLCSRDDYGGEAK